MNATCPRCGTVSLVSAQAKHFTCKTCRLHFCHECRHWQVDRKQSYCANCGAVFSLPPPVMPSQLVMAVLYLPLLAAFVLSPFVRLRFWYAALAVILLSLIYSSAYLIVFHRRTGLVRATRREAVMLARRTLTLVTAIYIVLTLGDQTALIIGIIITFVLLAIGLSIRRADAQVIQELQAHRRAWEAILSMSSRDAFLMRFPNVRALG